MSHPRTKEVLFELVCIVDFVQIFKQHIYLRKGKYFKLNVALKYIGSINTLRYIINKYLGAISGE